MTAAGRPTRWASPAKLNLCLHVTGRRADGYHLLQSVFVPIDWCDTLTIVPRADTAITRTGGLPGLAADHDLAVRAARLLAEAAGGYPFGVDIAIDKRIPAGAGLGGGSSNAGTVLVALNALWGLDWPTDRLLTLAQRLGADVPFFIDPAPAWVEGIGEIIQPVALADASLVVVVPDVHVATADVFGHPKLTRQHPLTTITALCGSGSMADIARTGTNDCESVVTAQHPQVAQALDWAEQFGIARMSGTGAAVFAVLDGQPDIGDAIKALPTSWRVWQGGIWAPPRCMATDSAQPSRIGA